MREHERIALAMITVITSTMAFVEGMIAVPAASTALAADALLFVQHSMTAGLAMRSAFGLPRYRWMTGAQGALMMLLGVLVCAIAFRRFAMGSFPRPILMISMASIALAANLSACMILLHARGELRSLNALWRFARTDAVSNISVIAAAGMVAVTHRNIPDLVIGGAMAGFFVLSGWRVLTTGHADAGQLR